MATKDVCLLWYRNTNSYFGVSGDKGWVKKSDKETNIEHVIKQSRTAVHISGNGDLGASKLTRSRS